MRTLHFKPTLTLCLALLAAGANRLQQACAAAEPPLPPARTEQALGPGLTLTTVTTTNAGGEALRVQAVRANLQDGWRLRLEPAEYSALKRGTTSAMATRTAATVAVNGGYFAWQGAALGAVKVEGEWIRLPWKSRTALGIGPQGATLIDNLQGSAFVQLGEAKIPVASLNGFPVAEAATVLTPRFGASYQLRANEIALEVEAEKVVARVATGKAAIRRGGFTVVFNGAIALQGAAAEIGQAALFRVETTPTSWYRYPTILGAGPRLLRAGRIETTEVAEEFRPDVIRQGPRTAIGIDKDGNFLLVAVDGRQAHSRGLTLPEMAQWMLDLGALEAINLDGGGSTTLVVNSLVINSPSDGTERPVANAVLLMREAPPQTSAQP